MLNYFFTDEKYEKERTLALRIINKLEQELASDTIAEHVRERKQLIHKCVKYYFGL